MTRRWLGALLAVALAGPAGAVAAAAPPAPAQCRDGGAREAAHDTGWAQGQQLVEAAWAALEHKCAALAKLEQAVHEALARQTLPPDASDELKCRHAGFEAGAKGALVRIAGICSTWVPPGGR